MVESVRTEQLDRLVHGMLLVYLSGTDGEFQDEASHIASNPVAVFAQLIVWDVGFRPLTGVRFYRNA